jgi:hypothetical protein
MRDKPALFPLGQAVATPGALRCCEANGVEPSSFLYRHQTGDWGVLPADDIRANEDALRDGARLLSSYPIGPDAKVWVITEADRSVTTLLLPSEY